MRWLIRKFFNKEKGHSLKENVSKVYSAGDGESPAETKDAANFLELTTENLMNHDGKNYISYQSFNQTMEAFGINAVSEDRYKEIIDTIINPATTNSEEAIPNLLAKYTNFDEDDFTG